MKNCIEKLQELTRECEPCIWNARIIEFKDLPEEEKYNFDYYDDEKDYLLYCEKCNYYTILETDTK